MINFGPPPALLATMANVHDSLFRWAFDLPQRMAGLLACVFPSDLATVLDFRRIDKVPLELLDKDLSEKRTDMVWKIPTHESQSWLFVVVEHQSRARRWMILRVLDYEKCVLQWCREHQAPKRMLPPVVAVVVSHDPRGWKSPTRLRELQPLGRRLVASMGTKLLDADYYLQDLQTQEDAQIRGWPMDAVGTLTLLLLKYGKAKASLTDRFEGWKDLWQQVQGWQGALPRFVWYILSVREDVTTSRLK